MPLYRRQMGLQQQHQFHPILPHPSNLITSLLHLLLIRLISSISTHNNHTFPRHIHNRLWLMGCQPMWKSLHHPSPHIMLQVLILKYNKNIYFKQLLPQMCKPHHLHMPLPLYRKALHKLDNSRTNSIMQLPPLQPCNLLRRPHRQQRSINLRHLPRHKCNKLRMSIRAEQLYLLHQSHWSQCLWHPRAR